MSDRGALLLALFLLLGNAFFVGAEFALISARRSQIEPRAKQGSRMARHTLTAMENLSLMMAGAQLGITICSLGLGAVGEPALAHLIEPGFEALGLPEALVHPVAFALALTIVVYLHVVLGEMVPKNIALAGPERSALVLGPPMLAIVRLLRPIIVMLNAIANLILRSMGVQPREEVSSSFTREEVAVLVEESRGEGLLEEDEYGRLAGALGFTEKTVETVLMPATTLTTVRRGSSAADVEAVCASTGFSRFPVADETGVLVGYLHIKDVLEPDDELRSMPLDDTSIRPFAVVAAEDLLHVALEKLQRRGAHMGQVMTPEGDSLGVITLEDAIEELVGEIRDAAHLEEMT